jgi:hypothetical protein
LTTHDLSTNGESALQRWILRFSQAGELIRVADVGANVGLWSTSMMAATSKAGRETDLRLHAFEPDSSRFRRRQLGPRRLHANQLAAVVRNRLKPI